MDFSFVIAYQFIIQGTFEADQDQFLFPVSLDSCVVSAAAVLIGEE